jgi:hypothetical protein
LRLHVGSNLSVLQVVHELGLWVEK